MKKILTIISFFITFSARCQDNTPITFSEVVHVSDSATKDQLYSRAQQWFASAFKDSKEVIQTEDKSGGIITGKAERRFESKNYLAHTAVAGVIRYRISIFIKDGRYKYELSDFVHDAKYATTIGGGVDLGLLTNSEKYPYQITQGRGIYVHKVWAQCKEDCNKIADLVIPSLTSAMNRPTQMQTGDW